MRLPKSSDQRDGVGVVLHVLLPGPVPNKQATHTVAGRPSRQDVVHGDLANDRPVHNHRHVLT